MGRKVEWQVNGRMEEQPWALRFSALVISRLDAGQHHRKRLRLRERHSRRLRSTGHRPPVVYFRKVEWQVNGGMEEQLWARCFSAFIVSRLQTKPPSEGVAFRGKTWPTSPVHRPPPASCEFLRRLCEHRLRVVDLFEFAWNPGWARRRARAR
ncbi:hypothetical protein FIBSPDRAFT_855102, partial [Athelia psychrophila]